MIILWYIQVPNYYVVCTWSSLNLYNLYINYISIKHVVKIEKENSETTGVTEDCPAQTKTIVSHLLTADTGFHFLLLDAFILFGFQYTTSPCFLPAWILLLSVSGYVSLINQTTLLWSALGLRLLLYWNSISWWSHPISLLSNSSIY